VETGKVRGRLPRTEVSLRPRPGYVCGAKRCGPCILEFENHPMPRYGRCCARRERRCAKSAGERPAGAPYTQEIDRKRARPRNPATRNPRTSVPAEPPPLVPRRPTTPAGPTNGRPHPVGPDAPSNTKGRKQDGSPQPHVPTGTPRTNRPTEPPYAPAPLVRAAPPNPGTHPHPPYEKPQATPVHKKPHLLTYPHPWQQRLATLSEPS
jgi:hypothetical protein